MCHFLLLSEKLDLCLNYFVIIIWRKKRSCLEVPLNGKLLFNSHLRMEGLFTDALFFCNLDCCCHRFAINNTPPLQGPGQGSFH